MFDFFKNIFSDIISIGGNDGSVAKSCLTLGNPVDCNLLGSSVRGIFQARILEWVATSSSRRSSRPRSQTHVSMSPALAGEFFTASANWEAQ